MELNSTRNREDELSTLKPLGPTDVDPAKIVSIKHALHIVPSDYIDSNRKILFDPHKGLTMNEVLDKRREGFVNVIPGLEERSWLSELFSCCSTRDHKQEAYAKIIRKHLSSKSTVIRDGNKVSVDREELVPGDILVLSKGDKVNADTLLLEISKGEHKLAVNAFLYTESNTPYDKEIIHSIGDPWDRQEFLLTGTEVVAGGGKALVLAVGKDTAVGMIMKSFGNRKQ